MNPTPDQSNPARPVPGGEEIQSLLQSIAAQTAEWQRQAGIPLTELLANWIIPQYLQAARDELATLPAGPERLKLLRQMASDAVALQRGASGHARLQLDREKLEFDRQKHKDALAAARLARIDKYHPTYGL
jgi:hypothetical protein